MRFGVLRRQVEGISSRVLTERLRTLEENGFVFRHYQAVIPPAVTYGITDRMKDIEKVLTQLEDLSRKWKTQGREGTPGQPHRFLIIALNPRCEVELRAGAGSVNLRCCPQTGGRPLPRSSWER
jgi:HxlR-like helix-turn-helix